MTNLTFKMHYLEFIAITILMAFVTTPYLSTALLFVSGFMFFIALLKSVTMGNYKTQFWSFVICTGLIFGFWHLGMVSWIPVAILNLSFQFLIIQK